MIILPKSRQYDLTCKLFLGRNPLIWGKRVFVKLMNTYLKLMPFRLRLFVKLCFISISKCCWRDFSYKNNHHSILVSFETIVELSGKIYISQFILSLKNCSASTSSGCTFVCEKIFYLDFLTSERKCPELVRAKVYKYLSAKIRQEEREFHVDLCQVKIRAMWKQQSKSNCRSIYEGTPDVATAVDE